MIQKKKLLVKLIYNKQRCFFFVKIQINVRENNFFIAIPTKEKKISRKKK